MPVQKRREEVTAVRRRGGRYCPCACSSSCCSDRLTASTGEEKSASGRVGLVRTRRAAVVEVPWLTNRRAQPVSAVMQWMLNGESCLLSAMTRPHVGLASARLRNSFRCPPQRNVEQCSPSLCDRTCSASAGPESPRDSRRGTHHPFARILSESPVQTSARIRSATAGGGVKADCDTPSLRCVGGPICRYLTRQPSAVGPPKDTRPS